MRTLLVMGVAFLAVLVGAGGCGKKTPPVPPQSAVPAPVSDLAIEADPEGVTLAWSWPRLTEKGASLRRVNEFTVERAEHAAKDFCAECPQLYQVVASLEGGVLPDQPETVRLTWRDQNLRPGYHYSYRIRSSLGWRVVSAPSAPVGLAWQAPLLPPTELVAKSGEREVRLSWQPPERDRAGQTVAEPLRYQVQRSEAGQPFRPLATALPGPDYTDQGVRSGVAYRYRVRAARSAGGPGEFGPELAVTPLDLTPPPVPFGLACVVSGESARLFWEPMTGEDLAGFLIFRRRQLPETTGDFELIGQVDGRASNFADPLPLKEAGEVRHYAIKSHDRAEPPNTSEFSREVKTTAKSGRP